VSDSRAAFDEQAKSYDEHAVVQADLVKWMVEVVGDDLEGGRCLEYGAGTGLLTGVLAEGCEEVVASDISEEMLRVGEGKVTRARWEKRDAWADEGDEGSGGFDLVASASLLQWADDPVAVLKAWKEKLAGDGRMVAGFFVEGSLRELINCGGEGISPIRWRAVEEWTEAFQEAGLAVDLVRSEERVFHFPSVRKAFGQWHGIGATRSGGLGYGELKGLMAEYEGNYRESEGVRVSWVFCCVVARSSDGKPLIPLPDPDRRNDF